MNSITLKIPVAVKAKVTEDLKSQLTAEIKDAVQKADMELQQIEFHAKRMLAEQAKHDAQGLVALRQQIDGERQKRIEFKNHMQEKLKETMDLELGAEIVQGTLERMVEVAIGDNLNHIMNTELLLEDGKIIAIRS